MHVLLIVEDGKIVANDGGCFLLATNEPVQDPAARAVVEKLVLAYLKRQAKAKRAANRQRAMSGPGVDY